MHGRRTGAQWLRSSPAAGGGAEPAELARHGCPRATRESHGCRQAKAVGADSPDGPPPHHAAGRMPATGTATRECPPESQRGAAEPGHTLSGEGEYRGGFGGAGKGGGGRRVEDRPGAWSGRGTRTAGVPWVPFDAGVRVEDAC